MIQNWAHFDDLVDPSDAGLLRRPVPRCESNLDGRLVARVGPVLMELSAGLGGMKTRQRGL